MIKIHPSSLGLIMSPAKSKKVEDLSVGALTHCYNLAKQEVYGFKPQIDNIKFIKKGNQCEDKAIRLYNLVKGTDYVKNTERKENDYLTGECDIDATKKIIDIKNAWSLATFPATKEKAEEKKYEWQGRAYMILWDKDQFELAYCMVSTPEELCKYEQEELHYVDLIEPELRLTTVNYSRDVELDKDIETKCRVAQAQVETYIKQIRAEHAIIPL